MGFRNPITSLDASQLTGQIQGSQLAADSIDGKTITGALIRTAATGRRLELKTTSTDTLTAWCGLSTETDPGKLQVNSIGRTGLANSGLLVLAAPAVSGFATAEILLYSRSSTSGGVNLDRSRMVLSSDQIELTGPDVLIGDGQAVRAPSGPYEQQAGKVSKTFAGVNRLNSLNQAFPVAYAAGADPVVQLTVEAGSNFDVLANVTGTSNAGFNYTLFQKAGGLVTGTVIVHWTALA